MINGSIVKPGVIREVSEGGESGGRGHARGGGSKDPENNRDIEEPAVYRGSVVVMPR
jgi:hypothetical protein